ncbi:Mitochondrial 18 kDa protein [Aphelenchoides fujianensis]|nr:Mitochondrial 18 kDa protein [Aphelenchoides fujianensis]
MDSDRSKMPGEGDAPSVRKFFFDLQQRWGESDLYRETPIRFLGYANEVGEAFRAWIPPTAVRLTYVVAFGYVLADALDKTHGAYKAVKKYATREERQKQVGLTLADTLVWQTFASVLLPGITINRLCAASTAVLKRPNCLPAPVKLSTTLLGLAAIPFIVKPIDAAVEVGMDRTLRRCYDLKQVKTPPVPADLVDDHCKR